MQASLRLAANEKATLARPALCLLAISAAYKPTLPKLTTLNPSKIFCPKCETGAFIRPKCMIFILFMNLFKEAFISVLFTLKI